MKQTGPLASGNFQAIRKDGPHAILRKYRLLPTVTIIVKKMFSVLWKNLVTPYWVGGWGAQRPFWERDSYYIPENWVEGTEFHLEVNNRVLNTGPEVGKNLVHWENWKAAHVHGAEYAGTCGRHKTGLAEWGRQQVPCGPCKEPGFLGLTFYLEIILKLQKSTKSIYMSFTQHFC